MKENAVSALSPNEYWRTAEYTPNPTANNAVRTKAGTASIRVLGSRSARTSVTGRRPSRTAVPRSPWRASPSQLTYRCGMVLSSWYISVISARNSGPQRVGGQVASSSSGLEEIEVSQNTTIVPINSRITDEKSRRTVYATISAPCVMLRHRPRI